MQNVDIVGVTGSIPVTPTDIPTTYEVVAKLPAGSTNLAPRHHLHFVGFRDDRYHAAVKVFGKPDFVHIGWDRRALREIGDGDVVVFADGPAEQEPRARSFPDILDGSELRGWW